VPRHTAERQSPARRDLNIRLTVSRQRCALDRAVSQPVPPAPRRRARRWEHRAQGSLVAGRDWTADHRWATARRGCAASVGVDSDRLRSQGVPVDRRDLPHAWVLGGHRPGWRCEPHVHQLDPRARLARAPGDRRSSAKADRAAPATAPPRQAVSPFLTPQLGPSSPNSSRWRTSNDTPRTASTSIDCRRSMPVLVRYVR